MSTFAEETSGCGSKSISACNTILHGQPYQSRCYAGSLLLKLSIIAHDLSARRLGYYFIHSSIVLHRPNLRGAGLFIEQPGLLVFALTGLPGGNVNG